MAENEMPQQSAGTLIRFPELVIGLVGPIGSDMKKIAESFQKALGYVSYETNIINIIEGLQVFPNHFYQPSKYEDERYKASMDNGDSFREKLGNDALALLAVASIRKERLSRNKDENLPIERMAYILKQLKTPEEIEALREIYRRNFVVVGVYSKKEIRRENLAGKIALSHGNANRLEEFKSKADVLINRDEKDEKDGLKMPGQNVQDAFQVADVFVNADGDFQKAIERIVELLFGNVFITPTQEEYGMFHARAASYRSSSLGRQVGAAIGNENGEIISIGCNEVPKAFGGT